MPEIQYDASQQWLLNLVLGLMVLGLALDIRPRDFLRVFKAPKAPLVGLSAQFILLPAFTCLLTLMLDLPAGVELGMILVAACPGGALSNFITHISGGNTALSISVTALASTLAIFLMPINFVFWASLNPVANELLLNIDVSGVDILISLLWVLALPLCLGFLMQRLLPKVAEKLHTGLKYFSLIALVLFIVLAVVKNQEHFLAHFWLLIMVVCLHNGLALLIGYAASSVGHLPVADKKAITLEVGMQNSSLAIAIVFTQFNAEYGMALISAFWGTWHIVSGLLFAVIARRYFMNDSVLLKK
ncbi:bile acid:sodium symporter family protein [Bermanella sp. R86510]|uniref:bile acid:sodium symporter family protein n=1 Tax=unclassified Bermanella TaxID=2627862 RepID=UPI0037C58AE4